MIAGAKELILWFIIKTEADSFPLFEFVSTISRIFVAYNVNCKSHRQIGVLNKFIQQFSFEGFTNFVLKNFSWL